MALNPNIILSGKIANPLEAMSRGMEIGDAQNTIRRRNALEQAYQQHGEGALAGNPESLNALARLGDFKNPTSIQAHRQDMAFNREEMEFKRAKARRDAADWAKTASEEEAARAEESLSRLLMGAAPFYERGDEAGYNAYLIRNKIDPAQIPFGDFISHAARAKGTIEGIKEVRELMQGPEPADEYQRYAAEERAKGQEPLSRIEYAQMKRGNGFSVTTADGTSITYGGGMPTAVPTGQNPTATATPRDGGKLSQKLSENDAATFKGMQDAATSATELESLGAQLGVVTPNVGYTGPGGRLYGALDDAVGVLPGDEGARGAFRSLAMDAQLAFTEKTKGSITDREMGMFREAVPNLGQRQEANAMIAKVMQAGAQRVQTRAAFFENWGRKHGSLEGAQEVWSEYMRSNPILEQGAGGGISVREEGDWRTYLNRQPAMSYTPDRIMQMTEDDIAAAPIETMTMDQIRAINERAKQLGLSNGQ